MTDRLIVNNAELVSMIKVGRRNESNFKMSRDIKTQFDQLKLEIYSEWKTYESTDSWDGVTENLSVIYDISGEDVVWIVEEAIREDVPLSPEIVGIIQRAKKMKGEVEAIAHLVDKPIYKVQEVLDSMPQCNCPACQLRRKMEAGEELTPEERMGLLLMMLEHAKENDE